MGKFTLIAFLIAFIRETGAMSFEPSSPVLTNGIHGPKWVPPDDLGNATEVGLPLVVGHEPATQNSNREGSGGDLREKITEKTSQSDVIQVQRELLARGYDLALDGILGPETVKALKNFQLKAGLRYTGRLDRETRSTLREPLPARLQKAREESPKF